jgi:phosphomannomutase
MVHSTVKSPNPEEPEANDGFVLRDKTNADIVVGTDPDWCRVRDNDGKMTVKRKSNDG